MKRYGSLIGLRPEKLEEYKRLHAAVWPEILEKIKDCKPFQAARQSIP